VDLSSEQARRIQFSGSEHAYAGSEVEEFRERVVASLAAYEAASAEAGIRTSSDRAEADQNLASAQRIRQQAVQMAERMLREVMGATGDDVVGLHTWQDAVMLRALAEEEMEFAREEARRLPAIAEAERDEMRAKYVRERAEVRAELQRELQASRAAAGAEAEDIRRKAVAEGEAILNAASAKVDQRRLEAEAEAHRIERRLAMLQTALADAEGRFRRLAATAANEVGTLAALADQDVVVPAATPDPTPTPTPTPAPGSVRPPARAPDRDLHLASIDLTDGAINPSPDEAEAVEPVHTGDGLVTKDPDVGFYQRRLAGLRDRLEKSGHPPE
jgi:uncharacterized protein YdaT